MSILSQKTKVLRGRLSVNEPLARYTSFRVGGKARRFYRPADLNDLVTFLQNLPSSEPVIWLGLGSNVLIRDGGINATVIFTLGHLNKIDQLPDNTVRAEAGVTCAKAAKLCARWGLAKAEFFAGIPGTIGGALAMNAGAFGGVTWEHVVAVETLDQSGKLRVRQPGEFQVGYREVKKPDGEWFVAGHFTFSPGDPEKEKQSIRELLQKRNDSQPIGVFSCGSVFRNPPGDYAAKLIEKSGLKGLRLGGAWVSEKHANFIVNGGEAKAADIEQLIIQVCDTVEQRQGVKLIPEVHIIGEEKCIEHGSKK